MKTGVDGGKVIHGIAARAALSGKSHFENLRLENKKQRTQNC